MGKRGRVDGAGALELGPLVAEEVIILFVKKSSIIKAEKVVRDCRARRARKTEK
jgi:hypothetical protein